MFSPHDLFIALQGNDAWSGRLAEPNAAGTDGPLASLAEARARVRQMKSGHGRQGMPVQPGGFPGALTVWIRDGVYPLTEPLLFGPEDSAPVTYAAYPGETPIFDGGVRLTGWRETTINDRPAWVVDLPEVAAGEWTFRSLFVNGRRADRPRFPRAGLYRMQQVPGLPLPTGWGKGGYTQFVCAEGDVQTFQNLADVEVVYVHFWIEERSPIARFNPDTRLVTMARPSRAPLVAQWGSQLADYYLDNVFEALTEAGQWYLDRDAGRVYYLPLPGEDPTTTEVYAPRAQQLLGIIGDPDSGRYVEFLRFHGLTFRHTDWRHPDPGDGARMLGTQHDPSKAFSRRHARGITAGSNQAASDVPGVLYLEGARHCAIEDCTLEHLGWYGIEVADACWGIRLVGNTIWDLGAGGVKINGSAVQDPAHRRTGQVIVTDNHIATGGRLFHSAVGVLSMHACQVAIRHNHIHDLFYSGVSCGWVWGYAENVSHDNTIEKNHIHDLGQGLLSDMGGIYTLGVQPGTVIRGNLIHDITKAHYGAWCIYPDEGSSHMIIEGNVCFRTNGEIFHQHYGRENLVRHNLFAFGGDAVIALGRVDAQHTAFTLERNILITRARPIFSYGYGGTFADRNIVADLNLLWDETGVALSFREARTETTIGLEAWRALGMDVHSCVADPQVEALEQGGLSPTSPAFACGIHPLNLSGIGPRPPTQRE
jgi:hypothetical protein